MCILLHDNKITVFMGVNEINNTVIMHGTHDKELLKV